MGAREEHAPGTVLGQKLKVIRRIGSGGMGAVYEVEHVLTKHRRALKVLHAEVLEHPDVVERFLREASAAGHIGSPHVVETYDAGTFETGEPYLVMELLEGAPLTSEMGKRGRTAFARLVMLMRQACDGVQAAHDVGIVHRDLKPDNLFVTTRDGLPFVKILDFGISKFDTRLTGDHRMTQEGSMLGTPYYMSPEQVRGSKDLDARSDVYALGVILYECAAGRRPYEADTLPHLAVLIAEANAEPLRELRDDLPAAFCEVVHKAMAPDPEHRFQSARELGRALSAFESDLPSMRDATVAAPPVQRGSRPPLSGGTVVMSDSAPPPRGSEAPVPTTPTGRPASIESAALGRTVGMPPKRRATAAVVVVALAVAAAALVILVRLAGTPAVHSEPAVSAASASSSIETPPSPSVDVAIVDAAAPAEEGAEAGAAAKQSSAKPPRPAASASAKPLPSATKSERQGLAQENPY